MSTEEVDPSGSSSGSLRKRRRLSGYNIFYKEFLQSEDSKVLSTLAEKNKVAAQKWKECDTELKKEYIDKASDSEPKVHGKRQEICKMLSQLSDMSTQLKSMGYEMFYTVVQGSEHFCGGTDKGCDFLAKDVPWIPYSFIGSVQSKPNVPLTTDVIATKTNNRQEVQKLFNNLYALCVMKPGAKLPYSKIQEKGLSLEGIDVQLKHPSSYGAAMLELILTHKDTISIKVHSSEVSQSEDQAQYSSDHEYGIQQKKIVLLSEHQQSVGMGFLSSESDIVDSGTVKVKVDYVQPETNNPIHHDEVKVGQFTTWPARLIRYA